jgi:hypothetical protein
VSFGYFSEGAVVTKPVLSDNLKPLQGSWKIRDVTLPREPLPEETRLNRAGIVLMIEGNRITHDGETVVTLANDLSSLRQASEMGSGAGELLMLTIPDGQGLLCSYRFFEDDKVLRIIGNE